MPPESLYRPLSVTERIFHRNSRYGGMNTLVMLELSGNLNTRRLDRALDTMVARRPLLRCRIGRGPGGEPAFIIDGNAAPPIIHETAAGMGAIDAAVIEESRRDFNTHPRPWNLRLLRLKGRSRRSRLLFSCDHSLVDGQTKFLCLDELLRIYAAPAGRLSAPAPLPPGPPLEHDFGRGLRRGTIARYLAVEALKGLLPQKALPHEGRAPAACRQSRFIHRELPAPLFAAIRKRCRMTGTTVHHAFLAALLFAWSSLDPARHSIDSSSNVNLRAAYPARETEWGVFVTVLAQRHRLTPETGFWQLAGANRRDMERRLERGEHRESALIMDWLMAREAFHNFRQGLLEGDRQGRLATLSLSNMGVPPIAPRYGPLAVEDVRAFGAQQAFGNLITYYFVTFKDVVRYTTATVSPLIGEDAEAAIARRFAAALARASIGDLTMDAFTRECAGDHSRS